MGKSTADRMRENDRRNGQAEEWPEDQRGDEWAGDHIVGDLPEPGPENRMAETQSLWPEPPAKEAYHGLAGEIVRAIEPDTEADPVAILVQTLVGFGNVIRRGPHFRVEADRHFTNLFTVLVGETAKGRKGTSWGRVRAVLERVDGDWAEKRIMGGLSSGEGLVWNVRDSTEKGPGESDKRLLIYEPEFANVLKQIERKTNTLSAIIRMAWDRGDLRTLTSGRQQDPVYATNAHISIVGHITGQELRRYLSSTQGASGFGNRFLWVCVRRSKYLPEGGRRTDPHEFVGELTGLMERSRSVDKLERDDGARQLWHDQYKALSDGKPGLAGALLARAEAQTMRLACIYALLDGESVIRRQHLQAALALWGYCERSTRFIFGDSLGDEVADEILRELKIRHPDGMTRTEMRDYFGRHSSSERLTRALGLLTRFGLAESQQEATGGRPVERWFPCFESATKATKAT
jgi:hypothetical protein